MAIEALQTPNGLEAVEAQIAAFGETMCALVETVEIRYYDINAGNRGVVYVGWNPRRWGDATSETLQHSGKARKEWETLHETLKLLVRRSAPERAKRLEKIDTALRNVIEQNHAHGAPGANTAQVQEAVAGNLGKLRALVLELPSAHSHRGVERLLVADTNALLFKPDLDQWAPPGGDWTVVLVPQVLRELDGLKMRRDLAEKATGVIKRIKEYGRRGDTFEGVTIAGDLKFQEVAVDADMSDTLTWLRAGHADDELLASALELRTENLQAVVALATRDRNLQNKAGLARLPYLDVEDDL